MTDFVLIDDAHGELPYSAILTSIAGSISQSNGYLQLRWKEIVVARLGVVRFLWQ